MATATQDSQVGFGSSGAYVKARKLEPEGGLQFGHARPQLASMRLLPLLLLTINALALPVLAKPLIGGPKTIAVDASGTATFVAPLA